MWCPRGFRSISGSNDFSVIVELEFNVLNSDKCNDRKRDTSQCAYTIYKHQSYKHTGTNLYKIISLHTPGYALDPLAVCLG